MDKEKLGFMIRKYRIYRDLAPQELADNIHIQSGTYVTRYERGERLPSLETLIEIANCLHTSMDVLCRHSLQVYNGTENEDDMLLKISLLQPEQQKTLALLINKMLESNSAENQIIDERLENLTDIKT